MHSSTTIGLKSRKSASLDVAPTHWFVSTPGDQHGLGAEAAKDSSRLVWKNADRRSSRRTSPPGAGRARRGSRSPTCRCAGRRRAGRAVRHERAAVLEALRAVSRPHDRDSAAAAFLVERLRRLDHTPHVGDVDLVGRVPPVRVQEVVLVVESTRTVRPGRAARTRPRTDPESQTSGTSNAGGRGCQAPKSLSSKLGSVAEPSRQSAR